MQPDQVRQMFTRADGSYLFARWGRPIVPVVFGVEDATLATVKGAIEAVVTLAGHKMAETDPERDQPNGHHAAMRPMQCRAGLIDHPSQGTGDVPQTGRTLLRPLRPRTCGAPSTVSGAPRSNIWV